MRTSGVVIGVDAGRSPASNSVTALRAAERVPHPAPPPVPQAMRDPPPARTSNSSMSSEGAPAPEHLCSPVVTDHDTVTESRSASVKAAGILVGTGHIAAVAGSAAGM